MTISTQTASVTYHLSEGRSIFSIPFLFFSGTDLTVTRISESGDEQTLTEDDYVVTLPETSENDGGITLMVAMKSGEKLTIARDLPLTQEIDFTEGDNFKASSFEEGLDRLTIMIQQLKTFKTAEGNYLKTSPGSLIETELPPVVSSALLGVNADGTQWIFSTADSKLIAHSATSPDHNVYQLWYATGSHEFKYWTGNTWENTSTDISNKADKAIPGQAGNLAALNRTGNLADSNIAADSLIDNAQPKNDQLTTLSDLDPTKGSLITGDGGNYTNLPVGADEYHLTADSKQASGLSWNLSKPAIYDLIDHWNVTSSNTKKMVWDNNRYMSVFVVAEDLVCQTDGRDFRIILGTRRGFSMWFENNHYTYWVNDMFSESHPTTTSGDTIVLGSTSSLGIGSEATNINIAQESLAFDMKISNLGQKGLIYYSIDASFIGVTHDVRFENIKGIVTSFSTDTRPVDSIEFYWTPPSLFEASGRIYLYGIKR